MAGEVKEKNLAINNYDGWSATGKDADVIL
jgi:hypothetical protein